MEEFVRMEVRQRKWMLYLLAIFILGATVTPYDRFFLGLAFGHLVSYYGLRILHNRAKAFSEAVIHEKRTSGLGSFLRLIGAGLAVWLALKFDHKVHIIGVVLGLTTSYLVMIVDYTIYSIRQSKVK